MWLLYFFKYRAHSRRAPPKPVIDLLCLTSIIITSLSLHQSIKKQQRRKRSFMKLQANAVRSTQPRSTQMPNCDFVFNRHTEHRFQLSRAVMRFLQPNQPTLANLVPAAHLHSMPLRAKCDFGLWALGLLGLAKYFYRHLRATTALRVI